MVKQLEQQKLFHTFTNFNEHLITYNISLHTLNSYIFKSVNS